MTTQNYGFMKIFLPAAIAGGILMVLAKRANASPGQPSQQGGGQPFFPPVTNVPPTTIFSPPAQAPTPAAAPSLAQQVADDLNRALLNARGNVTAAKGTENKTLVAQFQSSVGLKPDGLYGQNTRTALARFVSNAPPVFYFPKAKAG